jgi:upstream activation factor subunit UAF30
VDRLQNPEGEIMKKAPAKKAAPKKAPKKAAPKKAAPKKAAPKKAAPKKAAPKKAAPKKAAPKKAAPKKAAPKKAVKKAAPKKAVKKAAPKKAVKKVKRAPNPAFMAPMMPDAILGNVVGDKPMPRTEITKRLWDYIKKNNLQDKVNKRNINADEKLRPLFGKGTVSMFEMNRLLQGHLKKA